MKAIVAQAFGFQNEKELVDFCREQCKEAEAYFRSNPTKLKKRRGIFGTEAGENFRPFF